MLCQREEVCTATSLDEITKVVSVNREKKPAQILGLCLHSSQWRHEMGHGLSYSCVVFHGSKTISGFNPLLQRMLISAQNVRNGWDIRDHFR